MIKSGATIQNRYLNNPYPTNYNPMGRHGNFEVVRPHDSSSVFDTGMPKDVSPYQPRVAVSVSIQPKSVFQTKRLQRQAKQVNGAKWGQTALKSIFGGEENDITNYMAQRILGIVEGSDRRMDQSMQEDSIPNPLLQFRDQNVASSATSERQSTLQSDVSMSEGVINPTPYELADFTDLSFGEGAMNINPAAPPPPGFNPFFLPENQPSGSQADAHTMDVVAEIETQPNEAATQGGLMIPIPPPPPPIFQETAAGPFNVTQRDRTLSPVDKFLNRFDKVKKPDTLMDQINSGVKLKKVAPLVKKKVTDPMMFALNTAIARRRKVMAEDSNDADSKDWL